MLVATDDDEGRGVLKDQGFTQLSASWGVPWDRPTRPGITKRAAGRHTRLYIMLSTEEGGEGGGGGARRRRDGPG